MRAARSILVLLLLTTLAGCADLDDDAIEAPKMLYTGTLEFEAHRDSMSGIHTDVRLQAREALAPAPDGSARAVIVHEYSFPNGMGWDVIPGGLDSLTTVLDTCLEPLWVYVDGDTSTRVDRMTLFHLPAGWVYGSDFASTENHTYVLGETEVEISTSIDTRYDTKSFQATWGDRWDWFAVALDGDRITETLLLYPGGVGREFELDADQYFQPCQENVRPAVVGTQPVHQLGPEDGPDVEYRLRDAIRDLQEDPQNAWWRDFMDQYPEAFLLRWEFHPRTADPLSYPEWRLWFADAATGQTMEARCARQHGAAPIGGCRYIEREIDPLPSPDGDLTVTFSQQQISDLLAGWESPEDCVLDFRRTIRADGAWTTRFGFCNGGRWATEPGARVTLNADTGQIIDLDPPTRHPNP